MSLNKKVGSTSWFVLGKATLRCVKGEFEREGSRNGVFLAIMKSLIQQKGPLSPFKTAAFNKSFMSPPSYLITATIRRCIALLGYIFKGQRRGRKKPG